MALFGKNNRPLTPDPQPAPERTVPSRPSQPQQTRTVISPDTVFKGTISGDGGLTIHGNFEGKITINADVRVERSGTVKADIRARTITVAGTLTGNVDGKELVEISPEGEITGDIVSPRVVISEGAVFRGKVDMKVKDHKPEEETRAAGRETSDESKNEKDTTQEEKKGGKK